MIAKLQTALRAAPWIVLALCGLPAPARAVEDIEFVTEHLPEATMDNRYAALPVWEPSNIKGTSSWNFEAGWSRTAAGGVRLDGASFGVARRRAISQRWSLSVFAAAAAQSFGGGSDSRPLQVSFVRTTPLALPANATFSSPSGSVRDIGLGFAFVRSADGGWLGDRQYLLGVGVERIELNNYALDYRIVDGVSAGAIGRVDYSNTTTFATPLLGMSLPRSRGSWNFAAHAMFAMPLPRSGVQGRLTGPGFDLSGNTADAGNGKHYGDPAILLGLDVEYRPWELGLDVGGIVWQALGERFVHEGIDRNWAVSFRWRPHREP